MALIGVHLSMHIVDPNKCHLTDLVVVASLDASPHPMAT